MTKTHYIYLGVIFFLVVLIGILSTLLIQETHRSVETIERQRPGISTTTACLPNVENTNETTSNVPTEEPPVPCTDSSSLSKNTQSQDLLYSNSAIDTELKSCLDSESTTSGMRECLDNSRKKYEAILDKIYVVINNTLDTNSTSDEEMIREAAVLEKISIASTTEQFNTYRESICSASIQEASGGSIGVLYRASCYKDLTQAHIKALCNLGESGYCSAVTSF